MTCVTGLTCSFSLAGERQRGRLLNAQKSKYDLIVEALNVVAQK